MRFAFDLPSCSKPLPTSHVHPRFLWLWLSLDRPTVCTSLHADMLCCIQGNERRPIPRRLFQGMQTFSVNFLSQMTRMHLSHTLPAHALASTGTEAVAVSRGALDQRARGADLIVPAEARLACYAARTVSNTRSSNHICESTFLSNLVRDSVLGSGQGGHCRTSLLRVLRPGQPHATGKARQMPAAAPCDPVQPLPQRIIPY